MTFAFLARCRCRAAAFDDYLAMSGECAPENGETKAHTYHWIKTWQALGHLKTGSGVLTADHTAAVAFINGGKTTYIAYILSFRATGSLTRTIIAGLGLYHPPWTNVNETFVLDTEWQTFTLNFTTSSFGDNDSRVLFDLGAETGVVYIDDVSVVVDTE